MQPHLKNDLLYLLRILESSEKIMRYTGELNNAKEFYDLNDQMTLNACLNLFTQIGEQANKLSATLIEKHTQPDWIRIKGMRNRIVHDYTGIDIYIVFETIKTYKPRLKLQIIPVIRTELLAGNFDKEELAIAQTSPYLSHVDFGLFS
ncbi:MAG: DUF86 domain-containing protein [Chitinophagaceae bacterium]|nr:DUF86 domain-containing protein [Chitinophagaceae bacterium]